MISPSLSGGWSLRPGFGMLPSEISSAGLKGRMLQSQANLELLRILYPILTSLAKISTHCSYFAFHVWHKLPVDALGLRAPRTQEVIRDVSAKRVVCLKDRGEKAGMIARRQPLEPLL